MIWIVFACLTAFAVACVLWPLARRTQVASAASAATGFYRTQVQAIERDRDAGLMSPDDSAVALTEAARRVLGTNAPAPVFSASRTAARVAVMAILAGVPAFSVLLYLRTGNPNLPDAPLAARLTGSSGQTDMAAMIARMEAHVAAHPEDGAALELLAPVYMRLGRAADAAKAYERALGLLGETSRMRADFAEALVAKADGEVTPEARLNFQAALKTGPANEKARFYLALAAEQAGDKALALDIYGKLVAGAPPDAPYLPIVRRRMAEMGVSPPPPSAAATIAALPEQERMATIRSMVEGLAARLAQNGRDGEGWLRLIRAYKVLHEDARAKTALADARKAMAGDVAALARIDTLASELELGEK